MKQIPGIDIGPLRGQGLGLGGWTGTPPPDGPPPGENPQPEDGETTIVGPGGTIIGPPPGRKPEPEGGEGSKPDPSTKPPPKTKPEEEPAPGEAEHVGKLLPSHLLLTRAIASLLLRHSSLVEYLAFLPYYGGACIPQR